MITQVARLEKLSVYSAFFFTVAWKICRLMCPSLLRPTMSLVPPKTVSFFAFLSASHAAVLNAAGLSPGAVYSHAAMLHNNSVSPAVAGYPRGIGAVPPGVPGGVPGGVPVSVSAMMGFDPHAHMRAAGLASPAIPGGKP